MKHLAMAALTFALTSVTMLAGCSGDDNGSAPTNPYNKQIGNFDDEVFQTAFVRFQWSVEYGQGMLDEAFGMIDSLPDSDGAPAQASSDTAEWHDASRYWVREYTRQQSGGTSYRYVDSVQFLQNTTPVKYPDPALLTALKIGSRHSLSYRDLEDSLAIGVNVIISGAAGAIGSRGNVAINGSGYLHSVLTSHDHYDNDNEDCALALDFVTKYEDVRVNINNVFYGIACPAGGKIRHNGFMTTTCVPAADSLNYQKRWSCIAIYDGQETRLEMEDPTYRWIFEVPCDQYSSPPVGLERTIETLD